ncbi:MAG: ABC transporter ATP-binding protein [Candidatus Aminicenantia bacterium]
MKPFKAQSLSFSYKKLNRRALEDMNIEIEKGEFVGIIGRTGAGKTTLTLTMNGIIPNFVRGKFYGSVRVFGKDISSYKVSDFFSEVGIVFQDFETQIFSSSVEREIVFGLENLGLGKEKMEERLRVYSERMGIKSLLKRNPFLLSGGEKQRVVLCSILAMEPIMLVFDEPTTDIDPDGREVLHSFCRDLKGEKTILTVEHEMEKLLDADRIIFLDNGRIVGEGKPEQIFINFELFESHSMKPLELPYFFKKIGCFEIPFNPLEAKKIFDKEGYKILPSEDKGRNPSKIIEMQNLSYSYGKNVVLRDINIDIREGELVSIIGPNGSGKSTLLKLIAGILPVQNGRILIKNREIFELKGKLEKIIGFGFQNPDYQIFKESVREEIGFSLELTGFKGKEKEKRIEEILSLLNLHEKRDEDPFSLSKGERQKVVTASILATGKEIVILDEPTTGLDPIEVEKIIDLIRILKNRGITVIIVTHSLGLAFECSDWIILLKDGEVFLQGKPRELLKMWEKIESVLKLPAFLKFSVLTGGYFLSLEDALKRVYK